MSLPVADPSMLVDAGNLTALQQAAAAHNPQALRAAARQFESLFLGMVLKSMRQANFPDPLFGSDQENMYQDMYDDQIAAQISKGGGLGLADMLVQQLRRSGLAGTGQAGDSGSPTSTGSTPATGSPAAPGGSLGTSGASTSSAASTTDSSASSCPTRAQQLEFTRSLWPEAQQASRQLGVSPVNLVAQAALETDWGRSVPRTAVGASSNNLFGIKAGVGWSGASAASATREYENGTATAVSARFRAYGSQSQCFHDYVSLLRSDPRFAGALDTGDDTQAFAAALQRGGYATDPAYAGKLGAVAATLKSAGLLPTTSGSNTL